MFRRLKRFLARGFYNKIVEGIDGLNRYEADVVRKINRAWTLEQIVHFVFDWIQTYAKEKLHRIFFGS